MRALWAAGLAVLAAVALIAACERRGNGGATVEPPPGAAGPSGASSVFADRPRPAAAFADSVGVNLHLGYPDTPYESAGEVARGLRYLGVRHARDGVSARPDTVAYDRAVQARMRRVAAAAGVRFTLLACDPSQRSGPVAAVLATVAGALGGVVEALEGPNEYDLRGGDRWPAGVRACNEALHARGAALPGLARLPVLAPSLGHLDAAGRLGRLRPLPDFANTHAYAAGAPPEYGSLERARAAALAIAPGRPVIVTEAGYHDASRQFRRQPPVPRDVAAAYVTRLVLESFRLGDRRTFLYELADEGGDRLRFNQERHFGLFDADWRPKPAARALRNLLRVLRPGPQPAPSGAARMRFRVSPAVPGLRHVLLALDERRVALVVWRPVSLWDPRGRRRRAVAPVAVRLRLPAALRRARAFAPVTGTSPITVLRAPRSVPVRLGAAPLVVELERAG